MPKPSTLSLVFWCLHCADLPWVRFLGARVNVMRDEKDQVTLEMPLPGRPGRPPANGLHAMSDAERAQAYRARKAKLLTKAKPADLSDGLLLDKIRRAIDGGSAKRTVAKLVTELARRYP